MKKITIHSAICKKKVVSVIMTIFYGMVTVLTPLPHATASEPLLPTFPYNLPISVQVPYALGSIEDLHVYSDTRSGLSKRPLVIHIQSAHGNFEAEKNIQGLINHFHKRYGVDRLFLEGGVGRIDPRFLNVFPKSHELNLKIADYLAGLAELSGPELFLMEHLKQRNIIARGVEDSALYRSNRKTFQAVLQNKKHTDHFVDVVNHSWVPMMRQSVNSTLKKFILKQDQYQTNPKEMERFINSLKTESEKALAMNWEDAYFQKDWPMLIRYFRLKALSGKLDQVQIREESKGFFKQLKKQAIDLMKIKKLHFYFSGAEIKQRFRMNKSIGDINKSSIDSMRDALYDVMGNLPRQFDFRPYEHFRLYIQYVLLINELDDDLLFDEVERLKLKVLTALIRNPREREIVSWISDFNRLKKLFRLELNRHESRLLLEENSNRLRPVALIHRQVRLNILKKGALLSSRDLQRADAVYALAVSFYKGALARENAMERKVAAVAGNGDVRKPVILVTGGFHAEGMKQYFAAHGYPYVLISPRIKGTSKSNFYHQAMLESFSEDFKRSQIANRLLLQPLPAIVGSGAIPAHSRRLMLQAFRKLRISQPILESANRGLLASQYGIQLSAQTPGKRIFTAIKRSEIRAAGEWIQGVQKNVRERPENANESNLTYILETLSDALKDRNEELQRTAFVALSYLLETNSSLRKLPIYLKHKETIRRVFIQQFKFIQDLIYEPMMASLKDLVPLSVKIFRADGEQRDFRFTTTDLTGLANWIIEHRNGQGVEYLNVNMRYHTGLLPSQIERSRFVSLFIHLVNRSLKPEYFSLSPQGDLFDHSSSVNGEFLGYFTRLSAGIFESKERRKNENVIAHMAKRLREVQQLNLGLLAASIEDSYRIFFPDEEPFWREKDDKLDLMAQAYRSFERRFVSYLREAGRELSYTRIRRMSDSSKIYKERKIAARKFLLEEILYPVRSWVYEHGDYRYPKYHSLKELLPYLRTFEAMELQKKRVSERKAAGQWFIEKIEEIGDEYLIMVDRIHSGQTEASILTELTPEFAKAFREARQYGDGKFRDPFINSGDLEETRYYLEALKKALSENTLSMAHLQDPESIKKIMNFEARGKLSGTVGGQEESNEEDSAKRSEIRSVTEELEELRAAVRTSESFASEVNLKLVLNQLQHKETAVRQLALAVVADFISINSSLKNLKSYQENAGQIKKGLVNQLPFIKTVLRETPAIALRDLVALDVTLYTPEGKKESEFASSSTTYLVDEIIKTKKSQRSNANIQVSLEYDTGTLPSQIERGRFISLYLYLENRILRPDFYRMDPVTKEGKEKYDHGNIFRRNEGRLSYLFRLASAVIQTEETLKKKKLKGRLEHKLNKIQLLNLGMLLASAEDSYRIFFTEEIPFWGKGDPAIRNLAQVYRAFERQFVRLLREYNHYRNPESVEDIIGPVAYHEERIQALDKYLLEEILFPTHSWLIPEVGQIDPLNQLLPFFRRLEGAELNTDEGKNPVLGNALSVGEEFIHRMEEIGDEFYIAAIQVLSNNPLTHSELNQDFLNSYGDAGAQWDPLMDETVHKDYTRHYVDSVKEALKLKRLSFAELSVSDLFKKEARAEMRRIKKEWVRQANGELRMFKVIMNDLIDQDSTFFEKFYSVVFRARLSKSPRQGFARKVTPQLIEDIRQKSIGPFNVLLVERLLGAKDNQFGIVSIAVPKGLSKKRFLQALKEFQPVLKNHPAKVLVLTYPGKLSNEFLEAVYEKFDQRIFIFEGEADTVLKALYSGDTSGLDGQQNQKWAKRFFPRVAELNAGKATPAVLSESSLVVGNESLFNEFAIPVSKQFVEKSLGGFSAEDLFRAHLLFALPYASLTQAELIKEIQENAPELDARQEGDSVRLSFNSSQSQSILNLIRAAQKVLQAA